MDHPGIIICFLLLSVSLKAQIPFDFDSIPLYEYKFSRQIRVELAGGDFYVSRMAEQFSYIGKYDEALKIPNDPELEWGFDTLTEAQQAYFERFQPVDAIDFLIERASDEQIIILNEAHHKPQHRIFTRRLLKGLYDQGFRYFGLEALNNNPFDTTALLLDTALQERGYPLNSAVSGTYTREPQMANLIREAIEIGFSIFAYERSRRGDRELIQASNIYNKILRKDPQAKILIHCGWYHLLETENKGRRWMADHLKEITGIDPFTVYQDILTERYCTKESPYYQMVSETKPVVFVNEEGAVFNGPEGFDKFDVLLYHPRTHYIYNRPHWLLTIEENRIYRLDHSALEVGYPCLVPAYDVEEGDKAVPIDVIELEHREDNTALILPAGDYRLKILDYDGKEQEIRIAVRD
jgi:hypothetical protein